MTKKILILSLTYYPRFVGGAEVAIKEITDRIDPKEYDFHMITERFDLRLPWEERLDHVRVHRIGLFLTRNPSMEALSKFPLALEKPLFQFFAFYKAWSLHRRHKYDAVWAMMAHSTGVPAGLFKTLYPDIPYVLSLQEGDPPEYIEKKMIPVWPLFKRGFIKANAITAISTFLGKWARRMGFTGDISLVPNAVDVARFSAKMPEEELRAVENRLQKKDGDVFLITTSRLVHKNAVDDCIQALKHLPENVKLAVLGDGPLAKDLIGLAKNFGFAERVIFLGHIGQEQLPVYLKACNIFIRPSRSEGMGISFLEAMAVGLPVIATQEGGIADFLFDEKLNADMPTTGFAVPVDSPKQIAVVVKHIMEHPDKVAQVVENAKAMVVERYDWNTIAKEMKEVFDRVVKR
jgi:glycosyltransferase involved in cell wall biosynthesis